MPQNDKNSYVPEIRISSNLIHIYELLKQSFLGSLKKIYLGGFSQTCILGAKITQNGQKEVNLAKLTNFGGILLAYYEELSRKTYIFWKLRMSTKNLDRVKNNFEKFAFCLMSAWPPFWAHCATHPPRWQMIEIYFSKNVYMNL